MAKEYVIIYEQPYDFDDDDSGDSEHDVGWSTEQEEFMCSGNGDAAGFVGGFLKKGSLKLGDKVYERKGIALLSCEVVQQWGSLSETTVRIKLATK